eukprot:g33195.t1
MNLFIQWKKKVTKNGFCTHKPKEGVDQNEVMNGAKKGVCADSTSRLPAEPTVPQVERIFSGSGFQELDVNRDGRVDAKELLTYFRQAGYDLSRADGRLLLLELSQGLRSDMDLADWKNLNKTTNRHPKEGLLALKRSMCRTVVAGVLLWLVLFSIFRFFTACIWQGLFIVLSLALPPLLIACWRRCRVLTRVQVTFMTIVWWVTILVAIFSPSLSRVGQVQCGYEYGTYQDLDLGIEMCTHVMLQRDRLKSGLAFPDIPQWNGGYSFMRNCTSRSTNDEALLYKECFQALKGKSTWFLSGGDAESCTPLIFDWCEAEGCDEQHPLSWYYFCNWLWGMNQLIAQGILPMHAAFGALCLISGALVMSKWKLFPGRWAVRPGNLQHKGLGSIYIVSSLGTTCTGLYQKVYIRNSFSDPSYLNAQAHITAQFCAVAIQCALTWLFLLAAALSWLLFSKRKDQVNWHRRCMFCSYLVVWGAVIFRAAYLIYVGAITYWTREDLFLSALTAVYWTGVGFAIVLVVLYLLYDDLNPFRCMGVKHSVPFPSDINPAYQTKRQLECMDTVLVDSSSMPVRKPAASFNASRSAAGSQGQTNDSHKDAVSSQGQTNDSHKDAANQSDQDHTRAQVSHEDFANHLDQEHAVPVRKPAASFNASRSAAGSQGQTNDSHKDAANQSDQDHTRAQVSHEDFANQLDQEHAT